jgi:quercetin dioxygenase-like cupin family protein
MRRQSVLATLVLILVFVFPAAAVADEPPAPTTRHQIRVDGLPIAGPADVLAFLVESPPGAQTAPHTHPGLVVATTLEGEVTLTTGGVENTYKVGEVLTEPPGVVAVARNRGAVPTTPLPAQPGMAVLPTCSTRASGIRASISAATWLATSIARGSHGRTTSAGSS